MGIDIGLPPIATLLIALLVLAILSDFLLELYSIRMSQCAGRFQAWLFDHVGQNSVTDFFIAILFQFVSFRKKGFFQQFSSLVNVGSFTHKQTYMLVLGSFVGIGFSLLLLFPAYLPIGASICFASFILGLFWKDQFRDLGVALLGLGLFLTSLALFDQFLNQSTLNIQYLHITEVFALGIVFFATLFFRTPVAFLISFALLHRYFDFNVLWFPMVFFLHSWTSLVRYYWQFFQGRKRLTSTIVITELIQSLQFLISLGLVYIFKADLEPFMKVESFLSAFQLVVGSYFVYSSLTLLGAFPLLFALNWLPYFNKSEEKKAEAQKIINTDQRGQCFSIHLSLFLLRQEFKKYTTSVHTVFKFSRESDYEEEVINHKFVRYQGMLVRVGDELKELCFSIGKQRSYRWQVKEIMSYYKIVNQLELLVDDLGMVSSMLRKKDIEEEWEKECRFWLGLQLKLFEYFLNYTLGVGKEEAEKVQANIDKSYEVLDRFFVDKKTMDGMTVTSQTFYRITESIGSLAL